MSQVERAKAAKTLLSARLLSIASIHGVGTELIDGEWVVVVHVDPTEPPTAGTVPDIVDGVRVVMVPDAPFRAFDRD